VQGSGFWLYTVTVEKVKSVEKTSSSDNGHQLPEDFRDNVAASLAQYILPEMGGVRVTKLARFANSLEAIAESVSKVEENLALEREAERELRVSRVRSGRAKRKIKHSLKFLDDAEVIGMNMKELRPGSLNFQPAREALEQLERTFSDLESTGAALIHPDLRKASEESLATRTPYRLSHPEFKPTPKSQKLMHRAVEMLDDEIQKFTRGKVPPRHVNKFIAEFLDSLGWAVDVANVKTIRARYHEQKRSAATPGISPTRP